MQALKNRRQDNLTKAFSVSEGFNKKTYGESLSYTLESMQPISQSYTQNTYLACEGVQSNLQTGLGQYGIFVEFKYQGSVPTDTHIRNYSDIDMLTIHRGFYTLESPQIPTNPYYGIPVEDLKNLRSKTFRILDTVYSACDIDDSGSKCVTISGGSLNRKIDIIACNWFVSNQYAQQHDEIFRGIQVLDRDRSERILNYPFMHIFCINRKDEQVLGNEKRVIRLLKTLKADVEIDKPGVSIDVSSYDISSLIYNMDNTLLTTSSFQRPRLLDNTNGFLMKVIGDAQFRNSLNVPNKTRKIFCDQGCRLAELIKLQVELNELIQDISREIHPLRESLQHSNFYY
jgi:hypothetical protein